MKKYIIILLVISFLGCNINESSEKPANTVIQSSELINTLNSYNQELLTPKKIARRYDISMENPQLIMPVTRSSWRWVLSADALGALRGAIAGANYGMLASPSGAIAGAVVCGILNGAAASIVTGWACGDEGRVVKDPFGDKYNGAGIYEAAPMYEIYDAIPAADIDSLIEICQVKWNENVNCLESVGVRNADLDRIGAMHNIMVDKVMSGKVVDAKKTELEVVEGERGEVRKVELDVINNPGYQTEYRKMVEECINGDFSLSVDNLEEIGISAVAANAYNLFLEAYMAYPESMKEVDDVISYYTSNIASSTELTQKEKRSLLISFVVGAYTARYWGME